MSANEGWFREHEVPALGRQSSEAESEIEFAPEMPRVEPETATFPGISHAEALEREVPETYVLVEDLIERGTVGTIAGLPESHKSFLAVEIGLKVAAGRGQVLGQFGVVQARVSYWWQDDSKANELRRIQAYALRHGFKTGVELTWHLNEGLRLPDHLDVLEREAAEGVGLIVLDSLYNFLNGYVLKDEDVAEVFAAVKARVCDEHGATVLVVDHAPWPTESNRGQRRAYGTVFKAAAIRWGIYLDREGEQLHVEARGNNLAGLPRTLAAFDEDALELRLIDTSPDSRDYEAELETFLAANPRSSLSATAKGIGAGKERIKPILQESSRFVNLGSESRQEWAVWGSQTASDRPVSGEPTSGGLGDTHTPVGGVSPETARVASGLNGQSVVGDEAYPAMLEAAYAAGHLTAAEATQQLWLHEQIRKAMA